jgi:hypothetical protein
MSKHSCRPKPEDLPQFQNRKGPGGYDLDPTEAVAWFPELVNAAPADATSIHAGDSVLVGCNTYREGVVRFWLTNVEPSVEPGWFFGSIAQLLPENSMMLDRDQNIGFEPRHVFAVRRPSQ